jgi:hypothetical protein
MKANKILPVDQINHDECEVCELHNRADKIIPNGITCPHCNGIIDEETFERYSDGSMVVGGTNGYREDEEIIKIRVGECAHCNEHIGLLPIKIKYNGNHDIFYTGADVYLNDHIEFDNEKINKLISDYIERTQIDKEEDLPIHCLTTWITREIESNVAKYLFDHGLRFISKT